MPLNGRAYLLVGTGSRFEYFQSAYTGANKNLNIEPAVNVTQVPNSGRFNKDFYSSKSEQVVSDSFKGSLPAFIAAFISRKELSAEEAEEIQKMIDAFRKDG